MYFIIGKRFALLALSGLTAGLLRGEARTVAFRGLQDRVTVLDAWNFESDRCGLLPAGWWCWGMKTDAYESSRWVSNVASADGRQSFVIDFSQLPPVTRAGAHPTGYTSCRLKATQDGWTVFSFCFRRIEGKPLVEIRGPHTGGSAYQIAGFELAEDVRLLTGAGKNGGRPIVGQAPANVWRRISICFPRDNALPRFVYVRFDARIGDGRWREGAWMSCPMGEVMLTGAPNQINFLGYGRQKVFLDNFLWGTTPLPPQKPAISTHEG
jgi:hypothetical protein